VASLDDAVLPISDRLFLYLIVGGLSFIVEISTFLALRRAAMPVIPASVASFIVATLANYLLSILLAFEHGRFRQPEELARFLIVVLVGLVLNTIVVWIFAYPLAIQPIVAKISAVPIVLTWNYLGRRLFVFDKRVPAPVQSWLARTQPFSGLRSRRRLARARGHGSKVCHGLGHSPLKGQYTALCASPNHPRRRRDH
jgi:putative flippase GtrA